MENLSIHKFDGLKCFFSNNGKSFILCDNTSIEKYGLAYAISPEDIQQEKSEIYIVKYAENKMFYNYKSDFYIGSEGMNVSEKEWKYVSNRNNKYELQDDFTTKFNTRNNNSVYYVLDNNEKINVIDIAKSKEFDLDRIKGEIEMTEVKTNFNYANINKRFVSEERTGKEDKTFRNITCPPNTLIDGKDVSGYRLSVPSGLVHDGTDIRKKEDGSYEKIPNEHNYTISIPSDWTITLKLNEKDNDGNWSEKDSLEVSSLDFTAAIKEQAKQYSKDLKAKQKTISVDMNCGEKGFVKEITNKEGKTFYSITCPPNTLIDGKDVSGYRFTTNFANDIKNKEGVVNENWKSVPFYKDTEITLTKMQKDESVESGYSVADELKVTGLILADALIAQNKSFEKSQKEKNVPALEKTDEGRKTPDTNNAPSFENSIDK